MKLEKDNNTFTAIIGNRKFLVFQKSESLLINVTRERQLEHFFSGTPNLNIQSLVLFVYSEEEADEIQHELGIKGIKCDRYRYGIEIRKKKKWINPIKLSKEEIRIDGTGNICITLRMNITQEKFNPFLDAIENLRSMGYKTYWKIDETDPYSEETYKFVLR